MIEVVMESTQWEVKEWQMYKFVIIMTAYSMNEKYETERSDKMKFVKKKYKRTNCRKRTLYSDSINQY